MLAASPGERQGLIDHAKRAPVYPDGTVILLK